jgi:hypothetical protein
MLHDIGGEYLLFLNPKVRWAYEPAVVTGAVFVNYSCGVSKPWGEVTEADKRSLLKPSGRR